MVGSLKARRAEAMASARLALPGVFSQPPALPRSLELTAGCGWGRGEGDVGHGITAGRE